MTTNTGGPAFPSKRRVMRDGYATQDFEPVSGMTLRDYFAAKALSAVINDPDTKETLQMYKDKVSFQQVAALIAYGFADAMLKAREEK